MLLLAVAVVVVPLRFGLRSDRGMMGRRQQQLVTSMCDLQLQISVELEDGQDTRWINSEIHTQISGRIFVISKVCAVSSTSFQVDLTAGWGSPSLTCRCFCPGREVSRAKRRNWTGLFQTKERAPEMERRSAD